MEKNIQHPIPRKDSRANWKREKNFPHIIIDTQRFSSAQDGHTSHDTATRHRGSYSAAIIIVINAGRISHYYCTQPCRSRLHNSPSRTQTVDPNTNPNPRQRNGIIDERQQRKQLGELCIHGTNPGLGIHNSIAVRPVPFSNKLGVYIHKGDRVCIGQVSMPRL